MARPRSFDLEVALDRAMRLFWQHGYEGTSVEDLTAALGIAKPSLYAAFGNKRALFERVLDRYTAIGGVRVARAIAEPRALDVARSFLAMYVDGRPDSPPGCLLVQGALACSAEAAEVRAAVTARRRDVERMLARRLTRARDDGDLPADSRPADLARYLSAVGHGLAIQAAGGATLPQRRRIAEQALASWPSH